MLVLEKYMGDRKANKKPWCCGIIGFYGPTYKACICIYLYQTIRKIYLAKDKIALSFARYYELNYSPV